MILRVPKFVFVPFEYIGGADGWKKRDDLPRFLEPEEAAQYIADHPSISLRDGKQVLLQWQERNERALIEEFLQGVGVLRQ